MNLEQELGTAFASGNCVVLVGTGVSVAMSGSAPAANWPGMLRSGIEWAGVHGLLNEKNRISMLQTLDSAPDARTLIALATDLAASMGGCDRGDFRRWLNASVGELKCMDPSVGKAIGALGCPILTTNYDGLLEDSLGRHAATWKNRTSLQNIILGTSSDIGHLHGYWQDASSIVLTSEQYSLLLEDEAVDSLRRDLYAMRSLIFIGFGEGLDDPNFSQLRNWANKVWGDSEVSHYRLCLQEHWEPLSQQHRGENITPIPYGSAYSDLAPFLEKFASSATASNQPQIPRIRATEIVDSRARTQSVIGAHLHDADSASTHQLLIPPPLIPMTQEQFVASRNQGDPDSSPQREDPVEVSKETRTLLVGDENVGTSSALTWLAAERLRVDQSHSPIFVDYNSLSNNLTPLRSAIIRDLKVSNIPVDLKNLPQVDLYIDNINGAKAKRLGHVLQELVEGDFSTVTIACNSVHDVEVFDRLYSRDTSFRRHYIGRLGLQDVEKLVALVDPSRSEDMARKTVQVVRKSNLSSTPFTFSMVISALLRGETLMRATSPTSLLDAYTDLLLGRGDVDDDSRFQMDARNRSFALGTLAAAMVRKRLGSLTQAAVVDLFTQLFEELEWPADPVTTIKDLQDRRVIRLANAQVSFAQNSYLYLFAAKNATEDAEFLNELLDDAAYFSPILSHYAALRRSDTSLMRSLLPHLEVLTNDESEIASAFKPMNLIPPHASIEERVDTQVRRAAHPAPDINEVEPLEYREESEGLPFPISPYAEQSDLVRLITATSLVSNVLRDTDIFRDRDLRLHSLTVILRSWARICSLVESDEFFRSGVEALVGVVATNFRLSAPRVESLRSEVATLLPLSFALGGISMHLSSGKLKETATRCLMKAVHDDDPQLQVLSLALLADARPEGWVDSLKELPPAFHSISGVQLYIRRILMMLYLQSVNGSTEESALADYLADLVVNDSSDPTSKPWERGPALERLKQSKLKWGRKDGRKHSLQSAEPSGS